MRTLSGRLDLLMDDDSRRAAGGSGGGMGSSEEPLRRSVSEDVRYFG